MTPAMLMDLSKCIGCGACVLACQEINGLPAQDNPPKLSANVWTIVEQKAGVNVRRLCMHCLDPACVSVCPVRALHKTAEGPVVYDESRCIGCRYCMLACPFGVPKYEWDSPLPKVSKCIMCYEKRLQEGLSPACASVCPTGATKFGDRDDLIREARSRIVEHPERYVDHIYGEKEAGGTSILFLSPVPFAALGFKTTVQEEAYPMLTWEILKKIPSIVGIGGVLMIGIYWAINRRMMMQNLQKEAASTKGRSGDDKSSDVPGGDETGRE